MASYPEISIVIPVFNEEKNISLIANEIQVVLKSGPSFEILFVDDGSTDSSVQEVKSLQKAGLPVELVSFSRNFGHQIALRAGSQYARGACVIHMDCDSQHPPALIPKLLQSWQAGYEIVRTVRKEDPRLPWSKRFTSRLFYKALNFLSNLSLESGEADFRLLDRKVVDAVLQFGETDLFLRGLINWIGFKQTKIEYDPGVRTQGVSKYSFNKMLKLGLQGLTSFSVRPLHFATLLGLLVSTFSAIYGGFALVARAFHMQVISGWSSVITSVLFLGGIQLIMLGVMGEYLGKLFIQAKARPSFVIREVSIETPLRKS